MTNPASVLMRRDGVQAEVANNESVQIMQALGWSLLEPSAPLPSAPQDTPTADVAKRRGRPPKQPE